MARTRGSETTPRLSWTQHGIPIRRNSATTSRAADEPRLRSRTAISVAGVPARTRLATSEAIQWTSSAGYVKARKTA